VCLDDSSVEIAFGHEKRNRASQAPARAVFFFIEHEVRGEINDHSRRDSRLRQPGQQLSSGRARDHAEMVVMDAREIGAVVLAQERATSAFTLRLPDRRVLGSFNDFAKILGVTVDGAWLAEAAVGSNLAEKEPLCANKVTNEPSGLNPSGVALLPDSGRGMPFRLRTSDPMNENDART